MEKLEAGHLMARGKKLEIRTQNYQDELSQDDFGTLPASSPQLVCCTDEPANKRRLGEA